MGFDFIWIGLGIAIAGYFIGNGLKNFKNPGGNVLGGISGLFDEDDEHELIKENDVHLFIGISKEDVKSLIQDHPEVPHITVNNKVYYPKARLREWLKNIV
ncbi:helix-turn-helix domain-containing protein [bacterium LRH843]|nr:helix-turn-helix domain-containing protein [bacterium LRH843]